MNFCNDCDTGFNTARELSIHQLTPCGVKKVKKIREKPKPKKVEEKENIIKKKVLEKDEEIKTPEPVKVEEIQHKVVEHDSKENELLPSSDIMNLRGFVTKSEIVENLDVDAGTEIPNKLIFDTFDKFGVEEKPEPNYNLKKNEPNPFFSKTMVRPEVINKPPIVEEERKEVPIQVRLYNNTLMVSKIINSGFQPMLADLPKEVRKSRKDYVDIYKRLDTKYTWLKNIAAEIPEIELIHLMTENLDAAVENRKENPDEKGPSFFNKIFGMVKGIVEDKKKQNHKADPKIEEMDEEEEKEEFVNLSFDPKDIKF